MSMRNALIQMLGGVPATTRRSRTLKSRAADPSKIDRLTADWTSTSRGPNNEIRMSLRVLRARSRNLASFDDYGRRFMHLLKQNVVGDKGIRLVPDVKDNGVRDKNANEQIANAWSAWSRRGVCTMDGKLSLKDVQRLLISGIARDGEQLIRHIRGRTADNPFNYAIQLVEPDHLDETYERNTVNGRRVLMGVEFDQWHKVHLYHFLTQHPGEFYSALNTAKRQAVPADQVVHPFIIERANQLRGIPWIHVAMWRLNMLGGYEEAELVASRAGAGKMGFYTSPDGSPPGVDDQDDDGEGGFIEEFEPGRLGILPEGYDFKEFDPQHPNSGFKDFTKAVLRGVSSGINVSYTSLANDLEGVNYSSIRQGMLDERDAWRCIQDWFIENTLGPIYDDWLTMALTSNVLDLPARKIENFIHPRWKSRGWAWVDPLKEVNANIKAINSGLKSRQDVLTEQGRDLEDTFNELAEEQLLADELGISINEVKGDEKDNDTNDQDNQVTQNSDD